MKSLLFSPVFGFVYNKLRWFNPWLHTLECKFSDGSERPLEYTPVLIIGAPRSGSTLLYQVLTDYYDFGYLSNIHCDFYGSPSLLERLFHPLRRRQTSNYTSKYGQAQGGTAPSECGQFWYRFFRRKPQYVPLEEVDPKKLVQFRAAIRALGNAFGKPVLFKNMNCALRLVPTAQALPEALFIVVQRDLVANAHSLLKTRRELYGDYSCWWSMEPPTIDSLKKLPPYAQVVEQIRHIYALIEKDRALVGSDRFIDIQYETFCDDTYSTLAKLDAFFKRYGVEISRRGEVPKNFERRTQVRIDANIYQQLVDYVE